MTSELILYKKNKINKLNNIFNNSINEYRRILITKIKTIKRARLNNKIKRQQLNNLIKQYLTLVKQLNKNLTNSIKNIQTFLPDVITIYNKNALLIGINYINTNNQLYGCINDTNLIKERLYQNNFNNINIITDLTDIKPTRNDILNALKKLLIDSKEGDLLFFLYSGHGSYTLDTNKDETTGYDQIIIPVDLEPIIDDELKSIIQTNLKENVTLFALFDSCFSGSVLDLKYQYLDSLNYDRYTENNKQLDTLGNVFMISGCNDYQTSMDSVFNDKPNGAMCWSFIESLKQNPNCSWRELVQNMRDILKTNGYSQIPQFSCGQFENIDSKVFV